MEHLVRAVARRIDVEEEIGDTDALSKVDGGMGPASRDKEHVIFALEGNGGGIGGVRK